MKQAVAFGLIGWTLALCIGCCLAQTYTASADGVASQDKARPPAASIVTSRGVEHDLHQIDESSDLGKIVENMKAREKAELARELKQREAELGNPKPNKYERGWGKFIDWRPLHYGLKEAKYNGRLGFILVWSKWCAMCDELQEEIRTHQTRLEKYLGDFIMMNVLYPIEKSETVDLQPDGLYFPRLLYTRPNGTVMTNVYNLNGDPRYKYHYRNAFQIEQSMRYAVYMFKKEGGKLGERALGDIRTPAQKPARNERAKDVIHPAGSPGEKKAKRRRQTERKRSKQRK